MCICICIYIIIHAADPFHSNAVMAIFGVFKSVLHTHTLAHINSYCSVFNDYYEHFSELNEYIQNCYRVANGVRGRLNDRQREQELEVER